MNPDPEEVDSRTAKVIADVNERFRIGEWPHPTEEGREYPLRWDVFTGNRKIFQLTSMDVAGEAFVKAFGDKGNVGVQKKGQGSKKSKRNADRDGLLDEGDTSQDDAP